MVKGYQSQAKQAPSVPQLIAPQVSDLPSSVARGVSGTLMGKLKQFDDYKTKERQVQTQDKATEDAYRDSAEGKPFNKRVRNNYGSVYNDIRTATYSADAEIKLQAKSDEYAQTFSNNPEGYDNAFKSFSEQVAGNAPTAELNSVISLTAQKRRTATYGSLKETEATNVKKARLDTFGRSIELNINQILQLEANGDSVRAEEEKQKNLAYMATMHAEELITTQQVQSIVRESEYKITYGKDIEEMTYLLNSNDMETATQFLNDKTSVNREDMDVPQNKKYREDLQRLYNNKIKSIDANTAQTRKSSDQILKDGTVVRKNKKNPDNIEQIEQAKKTASPTALHNYNIQEAADSVIDSYGKVSLVNQRRLFEEYKKTEDSSRVNVEVMNKIESTLKEREARANNDVVGLAMSEGVITQPMRMDAQAGVSSLLSGLGYMQSETARVQREYGDQYIDLLSKQDAQSWKDWFDSPQTQAVEKLSMINSISEAFPNESANIYRQIGGKQAGMFTFSAVLLDGKNTKAAEIALNGASSKVTLEETFSPRLNTEIGNAFAGYSSDVGNNFKEGIINYSKGTITQVDEDGSSGTGSNVEDSIKATVGEIKKYNGQNTILPVGVNSGEFEDWLDNINIPGKPQLSKGLQDMSDVFGNGEYQLRYSGSGKYIIRVTGDNPYIISDADGKPFVLEWGKN